MKEQVLPNQYLQNLYMDKHRKGLMLTQNSALIKGEEYEFDQSFLIISLGQDDG